MIAAHIMISTMHATPRQLGVDALPREAEWKC